jgi:hypothetical protein
MKPEPGKQYYYPKDDLLTPLGVRKKCLKKDIKIKSVIVTNIYTDENKVTRVEFRNAKGKPSYHDTYLDKFDVITDMLINYVSC